MTAEHPHARRLTIDARDFRNAAELHAYLARKLEFPPYYGANLSALADCLEDVAQPTRITVVADDSRPDGSGHAHWLDGFVRVMRRCALQNGALAVDVVGRRGPLA